jgi:thiol-disulfide isomerase/thioredoxin
MACKPAERPAAPAETASEASTAAPGLAPELVVTTLDGRTFRLSEHRGQPVVLFLTASWCSSCIPEIATLNKLYEHYQDKGLQVVVVSIDPGDTPADLQRFKSLARGADYTWGLDTAEKAAVAFDVKALETKIVVGRDGQVVSRYVGQEPFESARAAVESAL